MRQDRTTASSRVMARFPITTSLYNLTLFGLSIGFFSLKYLFSNWSLKLYIFEYHLTMAGHSNPPDLNSVLQALSSLASQGSSSGTPQSASLQPHITRPSRVEPSHTPRPAHSNPPKPSTPTIDPSTITTWPAALRYVMRTVGQNEETQLRIRGLIRSQHNHERQWWKGREALLQRQGARGDKQKELDAVL